MLRKVSFRGIAAVVLVLLASICTAAPPDQWKPPKVAVIPFGAQNSRVSQDIVTEVYKSMCSSLTRSRRFEAYDQDALRGWLDKHLPDVKGTLEALTAARIGEAVGCDLVLCATVMNTGAQDGEYSDSFGSHNARMAVVAVDFTVISVVGSRVVTKQTIKGIDLREINADTRRFDSDLIKRAAQNSASTFVAGFYYPSDGKVMAIEADKFQVGLGKNQGITEKTIFEIFVPGLEIRDPGNGELVGYEEGENLYARPLKDTIGDDSCYAEIGKWKDVTKFLFESSEWRTDPEKLKMLRVGDKVRIRTPFRQENEEQ